MFIFGLPVYVIQLFQMLTLVSCLSGEQVISPVLVLSGRVGSEDFGVTPTTEQQLIKLQI